MNITLKQVAIALLCIIIAFIPTYIAITYYIVESNGGAADNYTVLITDALGNKIEVQEDDERDIAKSVLKMNSKLYSAEDLNSVSTDAKYYIISVGDGDTHATYKYYFSVGEGERSIVRDSDGKYYYLDFKYTKDFLSGPYAKGFYENSAPPTLSIFGGDDILPIEGEWSYKVANGDSVKSTVELSESGEDHLMNSATRLSFSLTPDRCTVTVKKNGDTIGQYASLEDIPYGELDSSSLTFDIYAEWRSSDEHSGYAKYSFTSSIAGTPEFFIENTTIASGEFFLVCGKNISAPQKIEFSSTPAIDYEPLFFTEGDLVYALIPIDKELSAPQSYVFNFAYGGTACHIKVDVTQRNILEREYATESINISRTDAAIKEYKDLLDSIGNKCEDGRFFSDKFLDYDTAYEDDVAGIILGYGHKRVPTNGDSAFRLDGVDYYLAANSDVNAAAAGKVVYVGECDLLGKFIVVDHGFGLKTWYCNIGEIYLTVGTTVGKGDAVGKSGTTGYSTTNGVYLITTVKSIPVCPYPLQDKGLDIN